MKLITLLISTLFCFSVSNAQSKSFKKLISPCIEKIINSQWTFNYFPDEKADKGFESPGFDDSRWTAVSLPHTWSTYETTGEMHPFIRNAAESDSPYWWAGWGWYRKHFTVNKEYAGRKVFIEFEGVQKYCKVWLNGKYLGDHKGGYGSFDFDLTGYMDPGRDNILAVAVNNMQQDEFKIPPMAAGNFDVYGGIYRDVTLVLKDKLHIPMQGSASHEGGTFVTTPQVSEAQGVVHVQTWVKNDYTEPIKCVLKTYIIDATNIIVQTIVSKDIINPGELHKFDQTGNPVLKPHLWSNEDPYLYKVYSEVIDGKNITDNYTSPLGFRWFRWDYKENFLYVNGKKVIIHGGNRHQEYPWVGDAIPKWITAMDYFDMAENMNYNFMRTAHYPNDKLVYELADNFGIAIDEESPSIKNQVFSVEVQEQQMKEMIRRDRNHPSIMFWSMGNETNHAVDSKFAVAEDTTRIITAHHVLEGSAGAYVTHTDENLALDELPRCAIRGWYNKDVKDLEPSDGQHSGTEEHQQNMLIASGRLGTGNLCTWLYEDHGADREYLNAPLLHVNPKGYVDSYRVPKYAYYLWQANYYEKPMVFILPHFWRTQYLAQKKEIVVNSNCDTVELKVNGLSKGFRFPDGSNFHSVTFKDIVIEKGTVSAIGLKDGNTVTFEVEMAGRPAKIVLTSSHQKIVADRASVAIITSDIVDAEGNHIYGATNTIKWSVSGPASLVGPPVYESDINKHHQMDGTMYTDMPVSNVIRSIGKPGKILVTVSASGLASGTIEITAEELKPDNTVIIEPLLENEGRKPVARNIQSVKKLTDVPIEIKETFDEFNIASSGVSDYTEVIRNYILKNNPNLDSASVEFKTLVNLFASQLKNNSGRLAADDYNFSAGHFNLCRLISVSVDRLDLPPLFKTGLKKYYAQSIITQGREMDPAKEVNWFNGIPHGGKVVFVQDERNIAESKGAIITKESELDKIIGTVHQGFKNFTEEGKERARIYIVKMNPYIHVLYRSEQNGESDKEKITNVVYEVEKREPILIPELKFISE